MTELKSTHHLDVELHSLGSRQIILGQASRLYSCKQNYTTYYLNPKHLIPGNIIITAPHLTGSQNVDQIQDDKIPETRICDLHKFGSTG